MKRGFACVVALLLAACHSGTDEAGSSPDCAAAGGQIVAAKEGPVCAMPADDAGASCTDSGQCQGLCLADGHCSASDSDFGCIDILEAGREVTICID